MEDRARYAVRVALDPSALASYAIASASNASAIRSDKGGFCGAHPKNCTSARKIKDGARRRIVSREGAREDGGQERQYTPALDPPQPGGGGSYGLVTEPGIDLAGEKKILDMSVAADLRKVYAAPTEAAGFAALDAFEETWSEKYPAIAPMWRKDWARLSTFYDYP